MGADPLKQIDAEIAHHYSAIDRHRVEILRLQEARDVFASIQHRTVEASVEGQGVGTAAIGAPTNGHGQPFRLTVRRREPNGAQPAPVAPAAATNGNGQAKARGRPKKGEGKGAVVRKWFDANPRSVITSSALMDRLGAKTKQEKQRVYTALHTLKTNGTLSYDRDGNYQRA